MGYTSGYILLRGGKVVSQEGTKIKLEQKSIDLLGETLNESFSKMMDTLTQKLKGSIVDGLIYFYFSLLGVKIEIIFDTKGKINCDGKLIIEILPGINSNPGKKPQTFSKEAFENIALTTANAGAIDPLWRPGRSGPQRGP